MGSHETLGNALAARPLSISADGLNGPTASAFFLQCVGGNGSAHTFFSPVCNAERRALSSHTHPSMSGIRVATEKRATRRATPVGWSASWRRVDSPEVVRSRQFFVSRQPGQFSPRSEGGSFNGTQHKQMRTGGKLGGHSGDEAHHRHAACSGRSTWDQFYFLRKCERIRHVDAIRTIPRNLHKRTVEGLRSRAGESHGVAEADGRRGGRPGGGRNAGHAAGLVELAAL